MSEIQYGGAESAESGSSASESELSCEAAQLPESPRSSDGHKPPEVADSRDAADNALEVTGFFSRPPTIATDKPEMAAVGQAASSGDQPPEPAPIRRRMRSKASSSAYPEGPAPLAVQPVPTARGGRFTNTYARVAVGLKKHSRTRLSRGDIIKNKGGAWVSRKKSEQASASAKKNPHFQALAISREKVRREHQFGNTVLGSKCQRGQLFLTLVRQELARAKAAAVNVAT